MSVATLVTALDGLQSDAERRQEYNAWLQEFQRSIAAWEVSYEVLSSPDFSRALKIFCAQTLRNKIAYDLHQVPRDARLHLKDQVLELLEKNAQLLSVVGVQLCIALAAFAMQVSEWEHPIEELMARFNAPNMVPLLFEFLRVLPEEFNSTRAALVDPSLRLQRSTTLVQHSAPLVLNFMLSRADIMTSSGQSQALFFEALNPWLDEVELRDIIASPLISWMFESMSHEEARRAAVDCLISVLRETSEIHETVVHDAIQVLFPRVIALSETYSPRFEEDEDLHRDMTRLISEAALRWHSLIAHDPYTFMPVLEAVKRCVVVPHPDLEIIEYTFDFFDTIRTMLGEPMPGAAPPPRMLDREPFTKVFLELLEAFTSLLEFPDSFNGNLEEEEAFRDFRYDIGDMLKVCSSIAGHEEALKWCYLRVEELDRSTTWQPIEAVLFSIRAIARTVPMEEKQWLPKIYHRLVSLPFGQEELVQHAVLMLLGRYSQWSALNGEFLEFELKYIIGTTESPFPEVRRAAAHAFLYLCTDGAATLVPFLPQLLELYTSLSARIDLESLCKYSDGLGSIINALPASDMTTALDAVFTPVMTRAVALVSDNGSLDEVKRVAYEIQGLGSMIAMINVASDKEETTAQHPLVQEIKRHSPLLTTMYAKFGPDSTVLLEGISRFFIHSVFNAGVALSTEIPGLLEAVASIAAAQPLTPVLFEVASAVVQTFNSQRATLSKNMLDTIWQFSETLSLALFSNDTVELLNAQGGIVDHRTVATTLIHHGFHFVCDVGVYYAAQFYPTLFEPALQLSVQVFNLCWDPDALIAVGHFFDDVEVSLRTDHRQPEIATEAKHVSAGIEKYGYDLVHALFYWFLLRSSPEFMHSAERTVDFLFSMAPVAGIGWMQQVLETLPQGTISDEERMQFAQRVFQLMTVHRFRGIGAEMRAFTAAYAERNLTPR